ncbi:MAG: FHA domain-containing protein [Motiliproteus sp.]
MELIVEIVGRSGTVLERHFFDHLPITLGRSYQNDVVLTDPFVSAFHAQVTEDANGDLVLDDLGSHNGTSYGGVCLRDRQVVMDAGDKIKLGKSHLRMFSADHVVADALLLSPMEEVFHRIARLWVLLFSLLLLAGLWLFEQHMVQLGDFNVVNHLNNVLGLFALVLAYGGAWALIGRVIRHDGCFLGHSVIAAMAVFIWHLLENIMQWAVFNLNGLEWLPYIDLLLAGTVLLLLLRSSLFMATHLSRWSAHLTASALPLLLVGFGVFKLISVVDDFKPYPYYSHRLFPPALQVFVAAEQSHFMYQSAMVFEFEPQAEEAGLSQPAE